MKNKKRHDFVFLNFAAVPLRLDSADKKKKKKKRKKTIFFLFVLFFSLFHGKPLIDKVAQK